MIDCRGVPVVDYGELDGIPIGPQRNPITICQRAFSYFDRISSSDTTYRRRALNCADWIVDSAETWGAGAVLPYCFEYPRYRMPSHWLSAMAQAQAVQVMVRAHRLTGDDRYLSHACALLRVFLVEVDSGGVTHRNPPQTTGWWYEEYAAREGSDPMVLNGMLYSLLGLHEFHEYSADSLASDLFARGLQGVVDMLPAFDRSGHSYYDLLGNPAGGEYHQVHIDLLDSLYRITDEPVLGEYHDRWRDYANSPFVVRLFTAATRIAPVVFALNVILVFFLLQVATILFQTGRKLPDDSE